MSEHRLRVSEIFFSLQGETSRVGLPTIFIRLTGCPLRCGYCDTTYAFQGGDWMDIDEILARAATFPVHRVTVTGGEPLAQSSCLVLLSRLCDAGFDVSLETGGARDIGGVDARVSRILDIKTPGSGESSRNVWSNLELLNARDEVKFVLVDEADYQWAREIMIRHRLTERTQILLSPVHGGLASRDLAEWILRDGLPVRLQVQLHKLLWGEERGR